MFADMDKAFAELGWLNFSDSPNDSITEFLNKFDAIFTLNQDLLMEQQYKTDIMSKMLFPRPWHMPGMEPTTQPPDTPIREVTEWRPISDASRFAVNKDMQPYFKLHGSSNWIDHSGGHSMLVIGRDKEFGIGRHHILMWNFLQFREYLAKPDTRLMIIGYSFGDAHINNAIGAVADGGALRVFIIDPLGVDVLRQERLSIRPDYLGERLKPYLIGASRRTPREIFGGDVVEHGKVMRFFD